MAMFKRRSGEEHGEEEVHEKSAARPSLVRLNVLPIITAVLLVLLAGYAAYLQFSLEVTGSQRAHQEANAESIAAYLSGRIEALGDQVARVAVADEELLVAIEAHDGDTLRRREQLLAPLFPDAMRLRFILPSEVEPDSSVTPPLGYACLDLARQAESGKRPPLELHLFGSEGAHLDVVRPLRSDGRVVASLMVTLSPATVKQWLAEVKPGEAYIELQQGADGPHFASLGSVALKQGEPLARVSVAGSGWQLAYWFGNGIGVAEAQKVAFLATFAVAAAVLALLLFLFALRLSSRVNRELTAMVDFIIESSHGKRFHSYPVKLQELERALQALEPVLTRPRGQETITKKAEKGDTGTPDLMFADFGKITVEEEQGEKPTADEAPREKP